MLFREVRAIRRRPASPGKEYKEARVDSKIENEIKKYISENSREEVRENLELNFSKTKYLMKEGLGRFSKSYHFIGVNFIQSDDLKQK